MYLCKIYEYIQISLRKKISYSVYKTLVYIYIYFYKILYVVLIVFHLIVFTLFYIVFMFFQCIKYRHYVDYLAWIKYFLFGSNSNEWKTNTIVSNNDITICHTSTIFIVSLTIRWCTKTHLNFRKYKR